MRYRHIDHPESDLAQSTKVPTDSYVFCGRNGKPIGSFKKSFGRLIAEAGVEFDSFGQRRTIYSLRHTYATFRLQEGVNHYILAQNMGTSVAMLEQFYGHTSNVTAADELMKTSNKKGGKGAPSSPRLAATLIGIAAGASGIFAVSLCCPENSLVHIGVWHGGTVVLMGIFGRLVLPRFLAW